MKSKEEAESLYEYTPLPKKMPARKVELLTRNDENMIVQPTLPTTLDDAQKLLTELYECYDEDLHNTWILAQDTHTDVICCLAQWICSLSQNSYLRVKISKLEGTVAAYKSGKLQPTTATSAPGESSSAAPTRVPGDAALNTIESLRSELSQLKTSTDERIKELTTQLAAEKAARTQAEQRSSAFGAEKGNLMTQIQNMTQDRDKEKGEKEKAQADLLQMTTERDQEKSEKEKAEAKLTFMTSEKDREKADKEKALGDLTLMKDDRDNERTLKTQAEGRLNTMKDERDAAIGEKNAALLGKQTAEAALALAATSASSSGTPSATVTARIAELVKEVNDANKDKVAAENAVRTAETAQKSAESERDQALRDATAADDLKKEAEKQRAQSESDTLKYKTALVDNMVAKEQALVDFETLSKSQIRPDQYRALRLHNQQLQAWGTQMQKIAEDSFPYMAKTIEFYGQSYRLTPAKAEFKDIPHLEREPAHPRHTTSVISESEARRVAQEKSDRRFAADKGLLGI